MGTNATSLTVVQVNKKTVIFFPNAPRRAKEIAPAAATALVVGYYRPDITPTTYRLA